MAGSVLVAGGTGALGAAVVNELAAAGHPVTATWIVERERERLEGLSGVELVEADLRHLLATVQNGYLRLLLDRLLGEHSEVWAAFRLAPAAKKYHQAYRHGLLEHSLSVAQGVSAISATFGEVDRDVAVTGALLHDIGKLDAYTVGDPLAIELTDTGKLHGEIALTPWATVRQCSSRPWR